MLTSLIDHSIAIADRHIAEARKSGRKVHPLPSAEFYAKVKAHSRRQPLRWMSDAPISEYEERMDEVRCEQAREARHARRGL